VSRTFGFGQCENVLVETEGKYNSQESDLMTLRIGGWSRRRERAREEWGGGGA